MLRRAQIPNLLTYARLLAVPAAMAIIMVTPQSKIALFWIFGFASLTDFFDGYLARKWNSTSPLGALIDPIADKLLVALMLLYLVTHTELSLLPVAVIILREIYISGLREFLAQRQVKLPVSQGGKIKTTLQMLGIATTLSAPYFPLLPIIQFGNMILWVAAGFALLSAVEYTIASWKYLRSASH